MTLKQTGIALSILIVLAAIVGLWASYSHPVATQQPEQHVLAGTATSTGYEYREVSDCFDITADYPATTSLAGVADQTARHTIEQSLSDTIAQFKKDNDVSDRDPEQTKALGICSERKFTLDMFYQEFAGHGTVSYFYTVYADSLGAHPNAYFITFVFDQNGNQMKLGDLFVATSTNSHADYLNQIAGIATVQVKDELTRRLGQDPGEGFFAEGTAPTDNNYQNWLIDGDTLVIEFPPYQVAAWAAGTFEVRIPLSTFKDILK